MPTGKQEKYESAKYMKIDGELSNFIERQIEKLGEATNLDERLKQQFQSGSAGDPRLTDEANHLSACAVQELDDYLRHLALQQCWPRYAAVGVVAAAFAQSSLGTMLEDEGLSQTVSRVLEHFVANSQNVPIRDQVEDLLNIAHRRSALVAQAAQGEGCSATGASEPAEEPCDVADVFGFGPV